MKEIKKKIALIILCITGMIVPAAGTGIMIFLISKGWQTLNLSLIFGNVPVIDAILLKKRVFNGIFPAVAGSFALVFISVLISLPVGMGAAIYFSEYASKKVRKAALISVDILASAPSIVIGLAGFSAAILMHRHVSGAISPCLLMSALSLAVLTLPYIIRSTQLALESVPESLRMAGLSLGASRFDNLVHIVLPDSVPGIMSGIVLAISRCAEDTAVIMLTGAVASAGVPDSLLRPFEAIPFYIFYTSSEYTSPRELATAYGAAMVLMIVCLSLFAFSYLLKRSVHRKYAGK